MALQWSVNERRVVRQCMCMLLGAAVATAPVLSVKSHNTSAGTLLVMISALVYALAVDISMS